MVVEDIVGGGRGMVGATAVVVVSSSGCGGESVMVVAPASPPPQPRRRSPRAGLGQRLRESVLSPSGLRRRDSLALLKQQPLVASLLVAGRRVTRSRSVSKSRSSMSGGSEDGQSPSHSSDYEEQDEAERTGSASLVGRMRGLRRDMQKKISRLKSPRGSTSSSPGPLGAMERPGGSLSAPGTAPHTAASCESIPTTAPPGEGQPL